MKYMLFFMLFISIGCASNQPEYYSGEFDEEDLQTLLCDVDKTECKPIKKHKRKS